MGPMSQRIRQKGGRSRDDFAREKEQRAVGVLQDGQRNPECILHTLKIIMAHAESPRTPWGR